MTTRLLVIAALTMGLSAMVFAAEEMEAAKVSGTLSVTQDDDGNVTGAKLTVNEETAYNVTMDEVGKKLAAEMNGEKVLVVGTVTEKDDAKWITVKTFKKVAEE